MTSHDSVQLHIREKELLASDLLKLHDAANKFGKFRIFASGG
jgi:hypothetical protein